MKNLWEIPRRLDQAKPRQPAPRKEWPDLLLPMDIYELQIFPGMGLDTIYKLWDRPDFPGYVSQGTHLVRVEDLIRWIDGDDVYIKHAPQFSAEWTADIK